MKVPKRKVLLTITRAYLREQRGAFWTGYIISPTQEIVNYSAMIKILFPSFPLNKIGYGAVIFVIGKKILNILVGWFDEHKGVWKLQTELETSTLNPYFTKRVVEPLDRIEKKLNL